MGDRTMSDGKQKPDTTMDAMKAGNHLKRPRLSVSMIVRNEERFIEGCLQSIEGLADELVIVDTGSTDRTIEIAGRFNARIIPFNWIDDFSAARNESLKHCSGDWVLYLDADERISPDSREELRRIVAESESAAHACLLRSEEWLPSGRTYTIAPYPRLFRRLPSFRFEGRVHEQIEPSIRSSGHAIQSSGIVIEHLGYSQASDVILAKCERNARLLRRQLEEDPGNSYVRFQLGNTLAILGRYEEANVELEKALNGPLTGPELRISILNCLAHVAAEEGKMDDGIRHAEASLAEHKEQVTARWLLATFRLKQHDFGEALVQLREIERLQEESGGERHSRSSIDAFIPKQVLNTHIGICLEGMGDFAGALNAYYSVLLESQSNDEAIRKYGACAERVENLGPFNGQLELLTNKIPGSVLLNNALIRSYLQSGDTVSARRALDQLKATGVSNDDTASLWIEYFIAQAEIHNALSVYDSAVKSGADSYRFHKAALSLMLLSKNLERAMNHLEKMGRGLENMGSLKPQSLPA